VAPLNRGANIHTRRFLACELWRRCGLTRAPEMLAEQDYEKPCTWQQPKANEWKTSFTDAEETAQWLTGGDFITAVFEAALTFKSADKHPEKTPHGYVIHNAIAYEGCLEKTLCCQPTGPLGGRNICVVSWTSTNDVLAYIQKQLVSSLVEQWQSHKGPLSRMSADKFKPWSEAAAAMLEDVQQVPTLHVCKVIDDKLILPQEVRHRFLRDPVRSNEWRGVLAKFDETYSVESLSAGQANAPSTEGDTTADNPATSTAPSAPTPAPIPQSASWFPDEPQTLDALKARYANHMQFDHDTGDLCYFHLVEDEGSVKKLFSVAKGSVQLDTTREYMLGHGAGTWLQSGKAIQHFNDHVDKSFVVNWDTDQSLCVLEHAGNDGPVQSLRQILQGLERNGTVNFELAGHKWERPPEVISGASGDRPPTQLAWQTELGGLNCGSAPATV